MNSATDRRIREALTVKSDASVFDASLAAWKRDESTPWGRLRRSIALRNLTKHIGAIPNLFDTGSHDVVLHNVLSYVENAGAALAAATYSLKPSGILSLMQVNRYSEAVNTAVRDRDLDAAMSRLDTKTSTARQFANVPVRRYASIGVTHRHGRLEPLQLREEAGGMLDLVVDDVPGDAEDAVVCGHLCGGVHTASSGREYDILPTTSPTAPRRQLVQSPPRFE